MGTRRSALKQVKLLASVVLAALMVSACGTSKTASPDNYPTKPITMYVGYSAGGATDVGVRILSSYLEKELGQPVTVVNKPGASGWVALNELAQATPDGYTIGTMNSPSIITGSLDPQNGGKNDYKKITPIALQVIDAESISVAANSPFKTTKDLIDYAKAHPGEVSVATSGVGTLEHLAAMEMEKQLGVKWKIIHLQGFSDGLTSLLGGHIDVLLGNVGEATTAAEAGQIRILGVMAAERSPYQPDVPTFKEQSINMEFASARGIGGPAGMPEEIVKKLDEAIKKVSENPEYRKQMEKAGIAPAYKGHTEFKPFLDQEADRVKSLMGW